MEMKFAIPKPAYPVPAGIVAVFSAAGFALQIIIPGGYGFLPRGSS